MIFRKWCPENLIPWHLSTMIETVPDTKEQVCEAKGCRIRVVADQNGFHLHLNDQTVSSKQIIIHAMQQEKGQARL